jgi:hypothetical protein
VATDNAGNRQATPSAAQATTLVQSQVTPTVSVTDANGTYNGSAFAATATVNGGSSLEGVGLVLDYVRHNSDGSSTDLGGSAPVSAGSYTVTASFAGSADFAPASASADFSISARPITVTADSGQGKVYGTADPAEFTYTITTGSLVSGDTFSGALSRVAGEDVGSYAIGQGSLALSSNYSLTYVGANFSITPRAVTVTADAKSKVYGDADPALTYQITTGSLAFSDTFSGALSRVAGEEVGSYAIEQGSLALSSNYSLTFVGANLSITARPITVSGLTAVYDPSGTQTGGMPWGVWHVRNSNDPADPGVTSFPYGGYDWAPVAGDWTGDGTATVGVVDTSGRSSPYAVWMLRNSNSPGAPDIEFAYGMANWTPVAGDWNGDGITTAGVVDQTGQSSPYAVWMLRNSNSAGAPDVQLVCSACPAGRRWWGTGTGTASPSRGCSTRPPAPGICATATTRPTRASPSSCTAGPAGPRWPGTGTTTA